jgi:hypothetical protein
MDMGEGRLSGIPDLAKLLAGLDRVPLLHCHRALAHVAILGVPSAPVIEARAVSAFLPGDGGPVGFGPQQMIGHTVAPADDDAWRRSQHGNAFLQVCRAAQANVGPFEPVIGLGPAGVILRAGPGIVIDILLG